MREQYRAFDTARRALRLNFWLQLLWRVKYDKAVKRRHLDWKLFVHAAAL